MMRRGRREAQIPFEYFRVFTFGSAAELVAMFGSLADAERVWNSVREQFMARWDLWGMPEAWWRFGPGIPDVLRQGPHAIITEKDAADWERIEAGRRSYLASIGIEPTPPRRAAAFGSG
jgi:hypothetical protein